MFSLTKITILLATVTYIYANYTTVSPAFVAVSFDVHVKRSLDQCEGDIVCNLPYSLSWLSEMSPHSRRLQHGSMKARHSNNNHFRDRTIVPIDHEMQRAIRNGEHISFSLRLEGLSGPAQNVFLMDYTRAMLSHAKNATFKVHTDHLTLKMVARRERVLERVSSNGCNCVNLQCSCCEHLEIEFIGLNDTACLNLTYLPQDYGIRVSFDVDGNVIFNEEMSARNPPPICFGIPTLKEYASLCARFTKLNFTHDHLDGCVSLLAELIHVKVEEVQLGCFHLGNPFQHHRHIEQSIDRSIEDNTVIGSTEDDQPISIETSRVEEWTPKVVDVKF